MKTHFLLSLFCILAPLSHAASVPPPPVLPQQVVSSEILFSTMRDILNTELAYSTEKEEFSASEIERVQEAIDAYLTAARTAYDAQMDFALYSLKPLYTQDAQKYTDTLQRYRQLLQEHYLNDFIDVLNMACFIDNSRVPEVKSETKAENVYYSAIQSRGGKWDYFGRGGIEARWQSREYYMKHFELKQQYLYALMAPENDERVNQELITESTHGSWLQDYEFISCTRLQTTPPNYQATRTDKFVKAEEAWKVYANQTPSVLWPIPSYQGTGTGGFMASFRMELYMRHELFLDALMESL